MLFRLVALGAFSCSLWAQLVSTPPAASSATSLASTTPCPANQFATGMSVTGVFTCQALPLTSPTAGYSPNTLISGGGVSWVSNYAFTVGAATYQIDGVQYSSVLTSLTLSTADPTNDRIDVLAVNSAGAVVVVQGIAAPTPAEPSLDPATQLKLTFVYVAANTTAPASLVITDVYHQGTEWTTSKSGTPINLLSTNLPYDGTVDVEATSAVTGNYAQFQNSSTIDLATRNNLVLYVRSKAAWASTRSLQINWLNGTKIQGSTIVVKDGQFGFNSSFLTAYQQVLIPLNSFGLNGVLVDRVRVTVAGSGTAIGFYMDDITLQGGISTAANSKNLLWKGTWNATAAYSINDEVNLNGVSYVAVIANANSSPTPSNPNWNLVGGVQSIAPITNQFLTGVNSAGLFTQSAPTIGHVITLGIDNGSSVIATGTQKVYPQVNYTCTINSVKVSSDQVGSLTVDVWKANAAIPTATNKISGTSPATLASAQLNQNSSTATWTTLAIAPNDVFGFSVASAATITNATVSIFCQ